MGVDAQMLIKVKRVQPFSDAEIRRLSYELGSCFGPHRFVFDRTGEWSEGRPQYAVSAIDVYIQDGPDVVPEAGERFLEVHLSGRYYGVGYERGPLEFYDALGRWLEYRLPGCEVWYGGDSAGLCARPFDAVERDVLFRYFVAHGHRPYQGPTNSARLCSFCQEPMWQNDMGRNGQFEAYFCNGCGLSQSTSDGGQTWQEEIK